MPIVPIIICAVLAALCLVYMIATIFTTTEITPLPKNPPRRYL